MIYCKIFIVICMWDSIPSNSSFRFTTPCYISRRGAERQSSQRLSHCLSMYFFHQLGEINFRDSSCHVFLFRRISELSLRSPPLCASARDFQPRILGLQLLPHAPPRTGRGRRLLLPLERHARCGPSLDLHIEGLVVAHLDPARPLPPPARRALLFGCSVGCCTHFVSTILSSSFACFFIRMRGCGP